MPKRLIVRNHSPHDRLTSQPSLHVPVSPPLTPRPVPSRAITEVDNGLSRNSTVKTFVSRRKSEDPSYGYGYGSKDLDSESLSSRPTIDTRPMNGFSFLNSKNKSLPRLLNLDEEDEHRETLDPEFDSDIQKNTSTIFGNTLASALGADNTPHTIEIDSIPCAGLRISHGPLRGMMAWRLVVRLPIGNLDKFPVHGAGIQLHSAVDKKSPYFGDVQSLNERIFGMVSKARSTRSSIDSWSSRGDDKSYQEDEEWDAYAETYVDHQQVPEKRISRSPSPLSSEGGNGRKRHLSASPSRYPDIPPHNIVHAVTTNFILDTTIPYSRIPPATLRALGYPGFESSSSSLSSQFQPYLSPPPAHRGSIRASGSRYRQGSTGLAPGTKIRLRIQGVTTSCIVGYEGEAARLGVSWLEAGGVCVGVGPRVMGGAGGAVFFCENTLITQDVPRTVKLTLQQRVRSMFGLK